jgi:GrpB-like predicted nucleotidyltransferase (UPF0157 family)
MKVTVVEYSSTWQKLFEEEKALLKNALERSGAVIEHIGSTSVIGLAAKPVIDIMIGLPDFSIADSLVTKIVTLGYEYIAKYEDVMPYRRYFKKRQQDATTHHIHMVEAGSEFWERHLLFRNYLRENPDTAEEYAVLKKALAEREWQKGNQYADAKTEFIKKIEYKARRQALRSNAT